MKQPRFSLPDFEPFAGAVLTRVSTPGQVTDGLSLETQEERGKDTLALLGLPCVAVYEDAGLSGDLYLSRPALQAMLTDLRAGRFNVVVVNDTSRLSWSTEHLPRLLREIHEAGGRVYLLTFGEFIDPDNHDQEFAIGVLNAADKRYRRHLRAESIKGRRTAARNGRQPCRGFRPFGYRVVTKKDVLQGRDAPGTEGTYVLIETEAEAAREIFAWYGTGGMGLREIARRLTEKGIRTAKGKETWHFSTISGLLQNPIYYGEAKSHWQKRTKDENRIGRTGPMNQPYKTALSMSDAPESARIVIPAPAIVTRALWEAANARLAENRSLQNGPADRRHLLSGLLRCPLCDNRLYVQGGTGSRKSEDGSTVRVPYHSYRCPRCTPETPGTFRAWYAEPRCERFAFDALQAIATDADLMRGAIEIWLKEAGGGENRGQEIEAQIERLQGRVASIEARRSGVLKADADPEFIAAALKDLSDQWKGAQKELADAKRRLAAVQSGEQKPMAADEAYRWASLLLSRAGRILSDASLPFSERRAVLTGLVASIVPDRGEIPFAGVTLTTRPLWANVADSVACMSIHITESSLKVHKKREKKPRNEAGRFCSPVLPASVSVRVIESREEVSCV